MTQCPVTAEKNRNCSTVLETSQISASVYWQEINKAITLIRLLLHNERHNERHFFMKDILEGLLEVSTVICQGSLCYQWRGVHVVHSTEHRPYCLCLKKTTPFSPDTVRKKKAKVALEAICESSSRLYI